MKSHRPASTGWIATGRPECEAVAEEPQQIEPANELLTAEWAILPR